MPNVSVYCERWFKEQLEHRAEDLDTDVSKHLRSLARKDMQEAGLLDANGRPVQSGARLSVKRGAQKQTKETKQTA